MKTEQTHNGMDIIDSRDIIARHSELQELRSDLKQEAIDIHNRAREPEGESMLTRTEVDELSALRVQIGDIWTTESGEDLAHSVVYGEDEESEFQALNIFVEDLPSDGEACIRDSYFETYAQELAEDIGAIGRNARWPLNHIDWEAAADELKADYSSFEWDGITYWYRDC